MQSFEHLDLPETLYKSLKSIGFTEPTVIQKKAIPILMDGRDLLACSETGSGKTAAYLLPMLKELFESPKQSGLILAPTRELAQQISQFLKVLVHDDRQFPTATLVGGQDIRKQFKSLQKKPRVIVATPGRLIDHLKRNTVQIHKVQTLVLDEGDRMIDMGFEPQLRQILQYLPEERQTSFFTATVDKKVQELAKKYLKNPATIMINNSRPVAKIKQSVVRVAIQDKNETILNELNARKGSVVVFLKTRRGTDKLSKYLSEYGVSVDLIHGGKSQGQRNKAIQAFKNGKVRVLCATDVAARGIDVPQVEHVINYDLPMQDEDYVHRVGRTARNGADGEAISFVTPHEHSDWNRLVEKYEIPGARLEITRKSGKGPSRNKSASGSGGRKPSVKRSFGKKSETTRKPKFGRLFAEDASEDSDSRKKTFGSRSKSRSKHGVKAEGGGKFKSRTRSTTENTTDSARSDSKSRSEGGSRSKFKSTSKGKTTKSSFKTGSRSKKTGGGRPGGGGGLSKPKRGATKRTW